MRHIIEAKSADNGATFTAEYATREELDRAYAALAALFGNVGDARHNYNVVTAAAPGKAAPVVFSAYTEL